MQKFSRLEILLLILVAIQVFALIERIVEKFFL